MALFMLWYGAIARDTTWYNTIADFPALSVGVTYLPIPIGGACLLLFVARTDNADRGARYGVALHLGRGERHGMDIAVLPDHDASLAS